MSYTALYRKYRPDNFDDVKGQEHIVTTIRNQIKYDRIGHAYLFCGTRGTGKTTIAKLLAKAVNCEHPLDGSPCEECASCKAIQAGSSLNVVEIDAASNNGVDNIRQINDAVKYSPTEGKYLVYIIDEVHMLSAGAFNALLKTLEEPPAYVIFILATTESHKVLDTIKSRCQRFDFRRISQDVIVGRLKELLDKEGIKATDEAVNYIASAADGSMRDSLSILDQCISFNLGEELTYDRVLSTIGAVDIDVYMQIAESLRDKNAEGILDAVSEVTKQGRDLTKFTEDFVWFFRNMLFIKLSKGIETAIDITRENAERIRKLGEDFSEHTLMRYLEVLQNLTSEVRLSSVKRVTLEMGLIKLLRPDMDGDSAALVARIEALEDELKKVESGAVKIAATEAITAATSVTDHVETGETGNDNDQVTVGSQDMTDAERFMEAEREYARTELGDKIRDIKSESPDEFIQKKIDEKKEEVRKTYGEAGYADIEYLASKWKTEVLPAIGGLLQKELRMVHVVPDTAAEANDGVALKIVADTVSEGSATFEHIKKSKDYIEEKISDIVKKKVTVSIQTLSEDDMVKQGTAYGNIENFRSKIQFENVEIQ